MKMSDLFEVQTYIEEQGWLNTWETHYNSVKEAVEAIDEHIQMSEDSSIDIARETFRIRKLDLLKEN
jgi:hypothetical protein